MPLSTALIPRGVWDQPPPSLKSTENNYPTLLFSWWATCCAAGIIGSRLVGRKMRSNKLFREDWIMMAALVPLFIRQALIHVVLIYCTNNVQTAGVHFTAQELTRRSIGSRLVLAARIFYAMFIWISKLTVSEFLKRITVLTWRRSYQLTLQGIRIFLFISFGAVVIATLTECQPFDHYWQVVPDPGANCRNGYAHLVSMGACDMLTDILLIAFPIPIVWRSGQTWSRKIQLAGLFSLSLVMIAVTATRVPEVIAHRGRQQYRTVWASAEILASAAVSNAVILASFLRDKGVRRNRYRSYSTSESAERSSSRRTPSLGLVNSNSDEDLFRSLGMRIPAHLQDKTELAPRPAPAAPPAKRNANTHGSQPRVPRIQEEQQIENSDSDDSLNKPLETILRSPTPMAVPQPSVTRAVSFFDVGGLLHDDDASHLRVTSTHHGVAAMDFAHHARRGSRAFLQDVSGLLTPSTSITHNRHHNSHSHHATANREPHRQRPESPVHFATHGPTRQHHQTRPGPPPPHPAGVLGPMLSRHDTEYSLQDAGGLLLVDMLRARSAAHNSAHPNHPQNTLFRPQEYHDNFQPPRNQAYHDQFHQYLEQQQQQHQHQGFFLHHIESVSTEGGHLSSRHGDLHVAHSLPDDDALPHIGVLPPASPDEGSSSEDGTTEYNRTESLISRNLDERRSSFELEPSPFENQHQRGDGESHGDADVDHREYATAGMHADAESAEVRLDPSSGVGGATGSPTGHWDPHADERNGIHGPPFWDDDEED